MISWCAINEATAGLVSTAIHNDDKHVYPSEIKGYDAYKLFVVLYC